MSREKELYRENLEQVRERFGDVQLIPIKEVSEFIGVDPRSLKSDRDFPLKKIGGRYFVGATALASYLC